MQTYHFTPRQIASSLVAAVFMTPFILHILIGIDYEPDQEKNMIDIDFWEVESASHTVNLLWQKYITTRDFPYLIGLNSDFAFISSPFSRNLHIVDKNSGDLIRNQRYAGIVDLSVDEEQVWIFDHDMTLDLLSQDGVFTRAYKNNGFRGFANLEPADDALYFLESPSPLNSDYVYEYDLNVYTFSKIPLEHPLIAALNDNYLLLWNEKSNSVQLIDRRIETSAWFYSATWANTGYINFIGVVDEQLFLSINSEWVIALALDDGTELWRARIQSDLTPVMCGNYIISHNAGHLRLDDRLSGEDKGSILLKRASSLEDDRQEHAYSITNLSCHDNIIIMGDAGRQEVFSIEFN